MKERMLALLAISVFFISLPNSATDAPEQSKQEASSQRLKAWAEEDLAKKEEQLNKTLLFLQSDKDDKIKEGLKGMGFLAGLSTGILFQVKYPDSPYATMPPVLVHLLGIIASPALQPRRETSTPSTFHRITTVMETAAAGVGLATILVYAYRHWHLRKINAILDEYTSLPNFKRLAKDQALLILTAYDQEPELLKKFIKLQPDFVKKTGAWKALTALYFRKRPTAGRVERLQNILAKY